jgi:hypothetical protein
MWFRTPVLLTLLALVTVAELAKKGGRDRRGHGSKWW